ncbi:Kinase [Sphingomonas sp. EC-HK361]|nr:Kinase [Sphingomonas sp. EC-HK361]
MAVLTPRGGLRAQWRTITLVVMAALGVAVVVALVFTLGMANSQRDRALRLQSHSYDVMILAKTLAGTIGRSEASLGRYVISGDKAQGQLYFDDWRLAADQLSRLDEITGDSGEQQHRIDRLRDAYYARGGELSLIALSTNYGKNDQALSRYYQARKAPSLAAINTTLDQIINRERVLLDQRTAQALATVEWSGKAASVLSVFGMLIVVGAIALGWLTVRAQTERAVARADADAARLRAEGLAFAVAEATEELRAQEARLRQVQKMEAVGQLTGGIAHDFNNMLAVVLGGLELAKRSLRTRNTAAERHIDSAMEGAARATALTRQLLAFAREEAINPEPIDAGGLLSGMSDLLDRTLGDAITVKVIDASEGWLVRADRVQLENAILNLAVNARDAMNGRGQMTITASAHVLATGERTDCPPGDYLTIAVTDTGAGMTPDVAERVFEPFFTTKPVGKGTGLGLSQIFGFVRQLGGAIAVDTAPGKGTTVALLLPRDTSAAPAKPATQLAEPIPAELSPLDILVVEDDPRVLRATMGALEELGHNAVACPDPLAAPAVLASQASIDLIITDVLMPGKTGPEMIAEIDARHRGIAVLFVTGFAGEAGEAGLFGGHHVLRKPFTIAALERAIDQAMADARAAGPHSLAAE